MGTMGIGCIKGHWLSSCQLMCGGEGTWTNLFDGQRSRIGEHPLSWKKGKKMPFFLWGNKLGLKKWAFQAYTGQVLFCALFCCSHKVSPHNNYILLLGYESCRLQRQRTKLFNDWDWELKRGKKKYCTISQSLNTNLCSYNIFQLVQRGHYDHQNGNQFALNLAQEDLWDHSNQFI